MSVRKAQEGKVTSTSDLPCPGYKFELSSPLPSYGWPKATFKFPFGEFSLDEKENGEVNRPLSIDGIGKTPLLNGLCTAMFENENLKVRYLYKFQVGGDKGWIKPPANKTNVYNNWARQTRFQVGDTVYFKYANDSVLVVNEADYKACNVNNPVSKHNDGKTVIELDHHGVFYFISGNAAHCKAGQKLIIDVLADHYGETETPSPALAPAPGGSGHRHASGPSGGGGVSGGDSWMPKSSAAEHEKWK